MKFFILIATTFFSLPLIAGIGPINTKNSQKQAVKQAFVHYNSLKTPTFEIFFENNGNIQDPTGNKSIVYPLGSGKSPLFASGFALSGYAEDTLRSSWMASASRIEDWQPGNLPSGGHSDPADPRFRVYKYSYGESPAVSQDAAEWPVDLGAPYVDANQNGYYEPLLGDYPEILGDQMIWYVINDAVPSGSRLLDSKPIGLEAQVSAFFISRISPAFDKTVFVVYKLINRRQEVIRNMIFSAWSDPDIGASWDDLAGTDTTRGLAYCYNDLDSDQSYGENIPSLGQCFILGPQVFTGNQRDTLQMLGTAVAGYKEAGMGSFVRWVNERGNIYEPQSAEMGRFFQEGLDYNGDEFNPTGIGIGGVATDNSKKMLCGTPELFSGWRDQQGADRLMLLNSEPFSMNPGDTQIIVIGYLLGVPSGGTGSRLQSLADLRLTSDTVRNSVNQVLKSGRKTLKPGTLMITLVNQENNPVDKARVTFKNPETGEFFGRDVDFSHESYQTSLFAENYDVRIVGYPGVWGRVPDTLLKKVSISENQETKLNLACREIIGYWDDFSEEFPGRWTNGSPGDTVIKTGAPGKNLWKINSGKLGWPASSWNGRFSVVSKAGLKGIASPVLIFTPASLRLSSIDTLKLQISNSNGDSWILLESWSNLADLENESKSYELKDLFSPADSILIRFQIIQNKVDGVQISLDDFCLSDKELTTVENENATPEKFRLFPAYPNPFNPATTLRWSQPVAGKAVIRILNLLGQDIQEINTGDLPAGENHLEVSFRHQPSGIYFYRIEVAGRQSETGKLLLVK